MNPTKNWLEILIIPLVLALVGTMGTYFITRQQESNANKQAESDRQVKILEIFAEKVTAENPKERVLAINLLRTLDPALAKKLAAAVILSEDEESEVKHAAQRVVSDVSVRS